MGKSTPALLSPRQRDLLRKYADSLPAALREPFICTVMAQLSGPEVGDAAVLVAIDHALGAYRANHECEAPDVPTICHP
jgi:hypothetical protein